MSAAKSIVSLRLDMDFNVSESVEFWKCLYSLIRFKF